MKKTVIIVLGSPNDPQGKLSAISKSRLKTGLKFIKTHPTCKLLLTGGWGNHFNQTKHSHAFYAQQYLLHHGLEKTSFLKHTLSSNTLEDASKSRPIINKHKPSRIMVVTSDYHITRAKIIFDREFSDYQIDFIAAKTPLSKRKLQELIDHEKIAINKITKQCPGS